ncbi:hypothetical protein C1B90_21220 [Salmonella enterica]|uniref:Fimbria/pilus periplasmic chaperone n=1 Tax=Salmonella enterica TaxID=28901 RepID=A0A5T4LNJ7_SALER|nr:hypothetical protein [Salmonella enterica]EBL7518561.1 hypothetical protein [Salmonella enterica]
MKKITMVFLSLICFVVNINANAFLVDSLSKVVDEEDEFIVIKGENSREYIFTSLSIIEITPDGKVIESKVNPEDVSQWPVITSPSEIIIDKYDEVRIKIFKNIKKPIKDTVMGLSLIPEQVKRNNKNGSALNLAIGYKVWLFISGTEKINGDVFVKRIGKEAIITNKTNKILRVAVDSCKTNSVKDCYGDILSMPGTIKTINIPVQETKFSFYMINANQSKVKELAI